MAFWAGSIAGFAIWPNMESRCCSCVPVVGRPSMFCGVASPFLILIFFCSNRFGFLPYDYELPFWCFDSVLCIRLSCSAFSTMKFFVFPFDYYFWLFWLFLDLAEFTEILEDECSRNSSLGEFCDFCLWFTITERASVYDLCASSFSSILCFRLFLVMSWLSISAKYLVFGLWESYSYICSRWLILPPFDWLYWKWLFKFTVSGLSAPLSDWFAPDYIDSPWRCDSWFRSCYEFCSFRLCNWITGLLKVADICELCTACRLLIYLWSIILGIICNGWLWFELLSTM